ncbi:MAG: M20/M25/M40 family metallo-hydrolase [Deltaproteobacteria bacterium]|nr:M20/M25/M40 family metallo-hydrolase [Deltaproteobacteria bacterium]
MATVVAAPPPSRRPPRALLFILAIAACQLATAQPLTPHQKLAREIHRELVEINTVTATGDTFQAANAMAARLRAAGFAAEDVQVLSPAPRKGNLVARLRGTGARRPILLLAHLDVVEARREDWSFDPFKLVEQEGYLYGRGVSDDKYMAAAFVANLIRYRQEGFRPARDIIVALETDEEILDRNVMGIQWLLLHHRDLIDAEFALNEGASVGLKNGKPLRSGLQTSEKVNLSYRLEVKNRGGHSSIPTRDNAIYHLAEGLARLARFDFPLKLNETTRAFFERSARLESGQLASDMRSIASPQPDADAVARLSAIPIYNAQLRTTCVATQLEGGHAPNALPQTARATVNCRILPGEPVEEVLRTLERVLADKQILVEPLGKPTLSPPSPLNPEILGAAERLTEEFWPGIPVIPTMLAAATDGSHLRNAGIPTYGHSGLAGEIDDIRAHGKDERILAKSFDEGHEYLYRLVKALSSGP